ncbi:ArsR family transcriptional regulator [Candidatus Saccharibacteria bacterium]|nr:ArsR family transcriptional regulator [Candidatus Saccharibacteria bacterium]MCL1963352.1 ArsR family transcriptional regulator [Candidatus Saccharibacteria bacterium]
MNTKDNIIKLLQQVESMRPSQIAVELGVSDTVVYRQLNILVKEGALSRAGSPPKVYYSLKLQKTTNIPDISPDKARFLDDNYLYITPDGFLKTGVVGLVDWAERTGDRQPFDKLVDSYIKTRKQADTFFNKQGLIVADKKISDVFQKIYLNKVYFSDFYSLPRFGRTKLGHMMFYAKQSQNRILIARIAELIRPHLQNVIAMESVDTIAFVPPSIDRKVQFLKLLKWNLAIDMPETFLEKRYPGQVRIAQKSLKTLNERIDNARNTIFISDYSDVKNLEDRTILLIDDASGSGSTLNEVAHKLKLAGAKRVVGYAIAGSFNGFDVISEA